MAPFSGKQELAGATDFDSLFGDIGGDVRILHIEDEPGFANLVKEFLEQEQAAFEVLTETDPAVGLERAQSMDIDCIVCDYEMPGLSGLEVLERVREDAPKLPFILFTGKGSEEIASEAITAGVTEYIQKETGTDQYTVLANRIEQAVARHRAEEQVERAFLAVETSHEGIGLLDEQGTFIYVNEAFSDLTAYDRSELVGRHFELLYPEGDVDIVYDEIIPTARDSGNWSGETEYITKDGDRLLVDHIISFTSEDTMICSISEATEAEAIQDELSLKERTMDEAPIGITIADASTADNPLIFANDRFLKLTGYDADEVIGRNCRFLQGEETRSEPIARMGEAISAEEPVSVELRNYRKDGEMFWNRVTIAPLYDQDGTLTHYVGFQDDVSRHREMVQEFANLGDIIDHDVSNLLMTARGRFELAQESGTMEHLDDGLLAMERLEQALEDVTGVLKSGQLVGERTEVDIGEVAQSVWHIVDPPDSENALETDTAPIVSADEDALRRLFENLLGNALEHCGEGVRVTVGALADGFYVEDTGPGIPDEHRESVFEPGFSTKESGDGTGVGLASVRQIVLAHGWEIRVTDGEDQSGARFEIHME